MMQAYTFLKRKAGPLLPWKFLEIILSFKARWVRLQTFFAVSNTCTIRWGNEPRAYDKDMCAALFMFMHACKQNTPQAQGPVSASIHILASEICLQQFSHCNVGALCTNMMPWQMKHNK